MAFEAESDAERSRIRVDLWADVACPWCYIGKSRLERAIRESGHGDHVDLRLHVFEIDSAAPATPVRNAEYVAQHMRMSVARALALESRTASLAAAEGLPFEVERVHARSFDALRLILLAQERGSGAHLLGILQDALFRGRSDVYTAASLTAAAAAVGIPPERTRELLAGDEYSQAVANDRAQALRLGANGVPFAVIGERFAIPGATSVSAYRDALEDVWNAA